MITPMGVKQLQTKKDDEVGLLSSFFFIFILARLSSGRLSLWSIKVSDSVSVSAAVRHSYVAVIGWLTASNWSEPRRAINL